MIIIIIIISIIIIIIIIIVIIINIIIIIINNPLMCVCGSMFIVDHAMICQREGLVIQRHNDIRDLQAELLDMVCYDAQVEPAKSLPEGLTKPLMHALTDS